MLLCSISSFKLASLTRDSGQIKGGLSIAHEFETKSSPFGWLRRTSMELQEEMKRQNESANWATIVTRVAAPRWLPILVGVIMAATAVGLWQALVRDQRALTKKTIEARTTLLRNEIAVQTMAHLLALNRIARRLRLPMAMASASAGDP